MTNLIYVTYDAAGVLTGAYRQDLQPSHGASHIAVDEAVVNDWYKYRANAARTGVELLPPVVQPLGPKIDAAIVKTYRDVDGVHEAAVGSRATEYADAESAARWFVAAGYTGAVSDYVSGFALNNPAGIAQTNKWAADQIIARADAFRAAQLSMRSKRFASQAEMRAATTEGGLVTAVSAWDAFIAQTRATLGL